MKKTVTRFIIIFIIIILSLLYIFYMEKEKRVDKYLKNQTNKFDLAYKTIYNSQKELANFLYEFISNDPYITDIYIKLQNSDDKQKDILRKNLYNYCKKLIGKNSFHLHFHLKNCESFLRMHKPEKFDDNLKNIRPMVAYVNKTHLPIDGFEQGRVYSGYRYIYPLISQNRYLGSVEISFGIDFFISKLIQHYNILSNFLANKKSVNSKVFKTEEKSYIQSNCKNYFFNKKVLEVLKKYRNINIEEIEPSPKTNKEILNLLKLKKTATTIYSDQFKSTITVIPVFNPITKDMEGFLKIREKSLFIPTIKTNFAILVSVIFILLISILLFIYHQIKMIDTVNREKKLIQNILDSIVNITFVTNFKKLQYANSAFLNFFNISSVEEFNKIYPQITDIFLPWGDYLHLKKNQSFQSFANTITHSDELKRKIVMFNKKFNMTAFSITISNLDYYSQKSYLLTLTDITEQELKEKEIEYKAYYDTLTNIYNRNKFNEIFNIELKKSKRYKIPFCIAIIDIDYFKVFNDTYGHLTGDEILIMLANEIGKNIRDTDTFARWGGEEFILLLSNTTINKALYICEKLREKITKIRHKTAGSISASFGVSEYKEGDSMKSIFKRCDEALYIAKQQGRNQVVSKEEEVY